MEGPRSDLEWHRHRGVSPRVESFAVGEHYNIARDGAHALKSLIEIIAAFVAGDTSASAFHGLIGAAKVSVPRSDFFAAPFHQ
jgi:hypothetical protein